jgi:hypothetical protein
MRAACAPFGPPRQGLLRERRDGGACPADSTAVTCRLLQSIAKRSLGDSIRPDALSWVKQTRRPARARRGHGNTPTRQHHRRRQVLRRTSAASQPAPNRAAVARPSDATAHPATRHTPPRSSVPAPLPLWSPSHAARHSASCATCHPPTAPPRPELGGQGGGVVVEQAELISATRLGGQLIDQLAAQRGLPPAALRMRRRRGELAIAQAIRQGLLDPASRCPNPAAGCAPPPAAAARALHDTTTPPDRSQRSGAARSAARGPAARPARYAAETHSFLEGWPGWLSGRPAALSAPSQPTRTPLCQVGVRNLVRSPTLTNPVW